MLLNLALSAVVVAAVLPRLHLGLHCCVLGGADSASHCAAIRLLQALKNTPPQYILQPNVHAEIWGILLKTGGSISADTV